jgi:hypothetical protein
MDYDVIFDVRQQTIIIWESIAPLVLFSIVLAVAGIGVLRRIIPATIGTPRWAAATFCFVGALFSIYLALNTYINTQRTKEHYANILANNKGSSIEGCVVEYRPRETLDRGPLESFRVDGILFEYNGSQSHYGFHLTKARGGPIREGLPVRITYMNDVILRIEVAENNHCE